MTQDALAEALPLLSWAEAVSQHYAMLRTEPPFTSTKKLKDALTSAYAALVRTPETLDVERLAMAMRRVLVPTLDDGDLAIAVPAIAAEYARLAASPAPDPGAKP